MEKWRKITQDETILDTVQHCHIEFCEVQIPVQIHCKKNNFSKEEDLSGKKADSFHKPISFLVLVTCYVAF